MIALKKNKPFLKVFLKSQDNIYYLGSICVCRNLDILFDYSLKGHEVSSFLSQRGNLSSFKVTELSPCKTSIEFVLLLFIFVLLLANIKIFSSLLSKGRCLIVLVKSGQDERCVIPQHFNFNTVQLTDLRTEEKLGDGKHKVIPLSST